MFHRTCYTAMLLLGVLVAVPSCAPSTAQVQRLVLDAARAREDRAMLTYRLDSVGGGFALSTFIFSHAGINALGPAGYGNVIGHTWGAHPDLVIAPTQAFAQYGVGTNTIKIAELASVVVRNTRKNKSGSITVEATLKYAPTPLGALLTSGGGVMANRLSEDVTVVLEKWGRGWKVVF